MLVVQFDVENDLRDHQFMGYTHSMCIQLGTNLYFLKSEGNDQWHFVETAIQTPSIHKL